MKSILAISAVLAAASTAFAQVISISVPAPGTSLSIGQSFVVEVDEHSSSSDFINVGIAVGIKSCSFLPCTDDNDPILFNPLFTGLFNPQQHEVFKPRYQNFTFTVPDLPSGDAELTVASFSLVGAEKTSTLNFFPVSLEIN